MALFPFFVPLSLLVGGYCRLFSCGTSKDGESFIVEWNESEGAVKRTYQGFRKRSLGVVQFDTTKNRFLAAGDDFSIKFWDMDNIQLLTSIDADGGLPVSITIQVDCLKTFSRWQFLIFAFHNLRQVRESALTKMAISWLFLPMIMGLRFWQIQMAFGCCVHMRIFLMMHHEHPKPQRW